MKKRKKRKNVRTEEDEAKGKQESGKKERRKKTHTKKETFWTRTKGCLLLLLNIFRRDGSSPINIKSRSPKKNYFTQEQTILKRQKLCVKGTVQVENNIGQNQQKKNSYVVLLF